MTPLEFHNAVQGFQDLENERQKAEWERARWMAYINIQPHVKKGAVSTVQSLAVFPWEEDRLAINEKVDLDEEQRKKIEEKWAKLDRAEKKGKSNKKIVKDINEFR